MAFLNFLFKFHLYSLLKKNKLNKHIEPMEAAIKEMPEISQNSPERQSFLLSARQKGPASNHTVQKGKIISCGLP